MAFRQGQAVSGNLRGEVCGYRIRPAYVPEENPEDAETGYRLSETGPEAASE